MRPLHVLLGLCLLATNTTPTARAAASPWATLLKRDLAFMQKTLLEDHPGPVDTLNKGFSDWLKKGHQQALDRAGKCESYEGYWFALEAYGAGFRDGHLGVWAELRRDEARWPGFLLRWHPDAGGKLMVGAVGEGPAGEGAPPLGSDVLTCDGVPARALLERQVFPFTGNPALERGWMMAASELLVDEANPWRGPPPRACTVRTAQGDREFSLKWRPITYTSLRRYRDTVRARVKRDFVVRPFGERGVWVGLPSFSASNEATGVALKAAIERAPTWRDRDPIVLDVRSNDGGSSMWGKRMMEGLYGRELVTSRLEALTSQEYVEWRVSPGNVAHMKTAIVAAVAKVEGAGSPAEARARAAAASFERALADGKSLWRNRLDPEPPPSEKLASPNPVRGRVFLLTDNGCGSACLDFADLMRALPGAQHVGQTTAADSVYMEIRVVPLPSGVATMVVPTKVYRNRPRGNNQPYVPHHPWKGDINDTAALERWILSLPAGPS